MRIRDAEVADAAAIKETHLQSWIATYTGLLPHHELAQLYERPAALDWSDTITRQPDDQVLVAETDEGVVGFAHFGPSENADDPAGWLHRLYVLPAAWGRGIGHRLHAGALARLRASGFELARLHVLENNQRARRFYEREGWRLDPAAGRSYAGSVPDVCYRYDLVTIRPPGWKNATSSSGDRPAHPSAS